MDKLKRILVITDADLDGAGCLLAIEWMKPFGDCVLDHKFVANGQFTTEFAQSLQTLKYESYDLIVLTDLSVPLECIPFIDRSKFLIIDHHKSHELIKDQYRKARAVVKEYPSCTKLIFDLFKDKTKEKLSQAKLDLIKYVNDYDSYTLEHEESFLLNVILKTVYSETFVIDFKDGYRKFTQFEENMVNIYIRKLNEQIDCDKYVYEHNGVKYVACFIERYASEVAHFILKSTGADVCICVNLGYGGVSFRRKVGGTVDVKALAEKLCNGGGHEYAAGGKITDLFMNFTKLFKPMPL